MLSLFFACAPTTQPEEPVCHKAVKDDGALIQIEVPCDDSQSSYVPPPATPPSTEPKAEPKTESKPVVYPQQRYWR